MTVKQLLNSIDSEELSEWLAYFRLRREQQRHADVEGKLLEAFGKSGK